MTAICLQSQPMEFSCFPSLAEQSAFVRVIVWKKKWLKRCYLLLLIQCPNLKEPEK